jgi:K+-transporting ATPase KdpF subunit
MTKRNYREETLYESCNLAAGNVFLGHYIDGAMLPVYEILRENLDNGVRWAMIYLTVIVAVFLFVYLVVALVRPEWF